MTRKPPSSRGSPSTAVQVITPAPKVQRDARQEAVIETIRLVGLTPRSAALSCQVPASTLYSWMRDPVFADEVAFAERQFERALASVVVSNAVKLRSTKAALSYLARRFPELWAPRLDLRVADLRTPEAEIVEVLTPEARAERLRALITEAERRLQAGTEPTPLS